MGGFPPGRALPRASPSELAPPRLTHSWPTPPRAGSFQSRFPPKRALLRANSGHCWVLGRVPDASGVLGQIPDNLWIFGRDSDAQRGENVQMSPDNHLSVQNPPENAAMSGTRPRTFASRLRERLPQSDSDPRNAAPSTRLQRGFNSTTGTGERCPPLKKM